MCNLQGCQMVYFHTQNPNLGKFWRALKWKRLAYSTAIWNTFRPFGVHFGLLEYISAIRNMFRPFGIYFGHLEYIYIVHLEYIYIVRLVYISAIWNIFRPFGIYFGHLEYISALWYNLCPFMSIFNICTYFGLLV
jgi:hypothetical protein